MDENPVIFVDVLATDCNQNSVNVHGMYCLFPGIIITIVPSKTLMGTERDQTSFRLGNARAFSTRIC